MPPWAGDSERKRCVGLLDTEDFKTVAFLFIFIPFNPKHHRARILGNYLFVYREKKFRKKSERERKCFSIYSASLNGWRHSDILRQSRQILWAQVKRKKGESFE